MNHSAAKNNWPAFFGVVLLAFTAFLDYTVVNTALPVIQRSLSVSVTQLQWVMTIYYLACCILMSVMGKLGDLFGLRRVLYAAAALFLLSSISAGFSNSITFLVLARLGQGIAGAAIFPIAGALIPFLFKEESTHQAFGIYGVLGGLGLAIGPLLGGLMVHWLSWRWVFFINVPIVVLSFLFCIISLPKVGIINKHIKIDWLGMLGMLFGIGGLVLAVMTGNDRGWGSPMTVILFVIAAAGLIFLYQVSRRVAQPLIDLSLFKNIYFIGAAILVGITGGLAATLLFFDPLYLQVIRNMTPLLSGYYLLAIPVMIVLLSPFLAKLIKRLSILGTIAMSITIAVASVLLHACFAVASPLWFLVLAFLLLGVDWSVCNTVSTIAAQKSVTPDRYGVATGSAYTMFNVMGSVLLALTSVIFHHAETGYLMTQLKQQSINLTATESHNLSLMLADPDKLTQLIGQFSTGLQHQITTLFKQAFIYGFISAMWVAFGISTLLLVFFMQKWLRTRPAK